MERIKESLWVVLACCCVAMVILGFVFGGLFLGQGDQWGWGLIGASSVVTLAVAGFLARILDEFGDILKVFLFR